MEEREIKSRRRLTFRKIASKQQECPRSGAATEFLLPFRLLTSAATIPPR
jgi:hypothetical protein